MTREPSILVVEDDDRLAELLLEYLRQHQFKVDRVAQGDEGVRQVLETNPDVVVLDLMLPGANGLDVCRKVRGSFNGAILMLTASQSEADHVAALELGADDFVTKPLEPRILLARIRTLLRRIDGRREDAREDKRNTLKAGPLSVDVATREVLLNGTPLPLTNVEFDIVRLLVTEAGSVVTRDELYQRIRGIPYDGIDRGMDVHVSRIRQKMQKLGFEPGRLKAVRGAGYLLAYR